MSQSLLVHNQITLKHSSVKQSFSFAHSFMEQKLKKTLSSDLASVMAGLHSDLQDCSYLLLHWPCHQLWITHVLGLAISWKVC